jgi:hypothetical protein
MSLNHCVNNTGLHYEFEETLIFKANNTGAEQSVPCLISIAGCGITLQPKLNIVLTETAGYYQCNLPNTSLLYKYGLPKKNSDYKRILIPAVINYNNSYNSGHWEINNDGIIRIYNATETEFTSFRFLQYSQIHWRITKS